MSMRCADTLFGQAVRPGFWRPKGVHGITSDFKRLCAREQDSVRLWRAGRTWEEIGAAHGTSADTARRDVERVTSGARSLQRR